MNRVFDKVVNKMSKSFAPITKLVALFLFLIFFHANAWGFTLDANRWHNFSGKLNNKVVYLTLFATDEGELHGSYSDCDRKSKVILSGTVNGNQIKLKGNLKGKVFEEFELKNISDSTDRLQGTRVDKNTNVKSAVSFRLGSMTAGRLEHRYSDFFGVDDDVEQFLADIQTAVRTNDKAWIAKNVHYPMSVRIAPKKSLNIKNQNQFIQNYDKIFTPSYKKAVLKSCTCNLFFNYNGVMLGSGEIWIYQKENSTEESYDFEIITINN